MKWIIFFFFLLFLVVVVAALQELELSSHLSGTRCRSGRDS